jgi:hypothetical protein
MNKNSKIISTYNIFQTKSSELCLIDPMILLCLIICICLFLYVIGYKLSNSDNK